MLGLAVYQSCSIKLQLWKLREGAVAPFGVGDEPGPVSVGGHCQRPVIGYGCSLSSVAPRVDYRSRTARHRVERVCK